MRSNRILWYNQNEKIKQILEDMNMRLRHIPGSEEEIANSPYVVSNPEEKKGRWSVSSGARTAPDVLRRITGTWPL